MKIKSFGYIGLGAADPSAWLDYGVNILGMMPARGIPGEGWAANGGETRRQGVAADGAVFLKMDERQWRVAVHRSDSECELLFMGLEVGGPIELREGVQELRAAGVTVREGTAAEAAVRAVTEIAFLQDPSGNALELFYGPTTDYNFTSPMPDLRFVAGHLGFGHCNLFVQRQTTCFDFYTRLLGFKLSDYIRYGPESSLQFLRCNARHHSLAMVDLGTGPTLQHLMFEMATIDDVGRTLDRAKRAGIEIVSALGRHRNDGTLSFYMRSPGRLDVEIGCDAKLLDDTWSPNEFCEGDVWGHDGLVEAVVRSGEAARARSVGQAGE